MKKIALFEAVIISLLIFVTACSSNNGPVATDPSTDVNADTVLDNNLFEQATQEKDVSRCNEISEQAKQKECIDVVNSLTLTDEAVSKLDSSLCKKITLDRYRESCLSSVEMIIKQNEADALAQKDFQNMIDDNLEISQNALDKGDYKICDQIEDENQMYSCRFNVIANEAVETENASLCDKIGSDPLVDKCKSGF